MMDPSPKSPTSENEIAWPEDDSDDEVVVKINTTLPTPITTNNILHVNTSVPRRPNIFPTKTVPWRRPGSNIADWFNYGFDERSYASYLNHKAKIESHTFKSFDKSVNFVPSKPKPSFKVEEKPRCIPYVSPYLIILTDHEPNFVPIVDPKEIEFFLS